MSKYRFQCMGCGEMREAGSSNPVANVISFRCVCNYITRAGEFGPDLAPTPLNNPPTKQPDVSWSAYEASQNEVARLRKELEAASLKVAASRHQPPPPICETDQQTIARLKSFSEDQARQIQALERAVGEAAQYRSAANEHIGELGLALEKARRK